MEREMKFLRRDNGPRRIVGKVVRFEDGAWRSTKIKIFTGPRKALRCR